MTYARYSCEKCYYEGETPCPEHSLGPTKQRTAIECVMEFCSKRHAGFCLCDECRTKRAVQQIIANVTGQTH